MTKLIPGLEKCGGLLAALVMVATAATAADLPGYGGGTSGGSARVHPVKLTSRQAAGIYTIGLAFPIASMDFDLGSAFSGVLYACDDTNVDADGDGVLDASASCQTLATLTADTSNSTMRARKLWYILDINTAESSSSSSMLTIKGTFEQVAASDQQLFNVLNFGAVADGVTDDSAAFNAASAEIATAGEGILYIPKGTYCLGVNGSGQVYSGLRITSSNVSVRGDGAGQTILRPCGDEGNYAIFACSTVTATTKGACDTRLTDVSFEGFTIEDLDTDGNSGHSAYEIVTGTINGGWTPARGDDVEWNSGTEDGTVAWYNSTTGEIGIVGDCYLDANSDGLCDSGGPLDLITTSDTVSVVGTGSNNVAVSTVEARTTEESHGLGLDNVARTTVSRVVVDRISDEGFDIFESDSVSLIDVHGIDCGREEAGGSCISISGSSRMSVIGGTLEGGTDSLVNSGAILVVSTNSSTAIDGVSITGTKIFDLDSGADVIEGGISLASNQAAIKGVVISDVDIDHDFDGLDALASSGQLRVQARVTNSRVAGRIAVSISSCTDDNTDSVCDTDATTAVADSIDVVTFSNVEAESVNDDGIPFSGFSSWSGGSLRATNSSATFAVNLSREAARLVHAVVFATNSCVQAAAAGVLIDGNEFSCGNNAGLDLVAKENASADGTVFINNYIKFFDSGAATAAVRVGQIGGSVADGSSLLTSANSFVDQVCTDANTDGACDDDTDARHKATAEVTNRGDLTP